MDLPNPFTPTFGKVPPVLAGRRQLLSAMEAAFAGSGSDPNLSSIIVGARGTGKTALLARIADAASASGWIAARVSAVPGMLEDIEERVAEEAAHLIDSEPKARLTGIGVGQLLSLEFDREGAARGNWRTRMNRVLRQLNGLGIGLLITVDEVRADLDEMIALASTYQHFVSEDKRVALVMAGLPSHVTGLVEDKSVSFLRRARRHHLGRIGDADIESAFRKTVLGAGGSIEDDALELAVRTIDGFPYMMQLVGYWTWSECMTSAISVVDVERGARLAGQEMRDGVLSTTYRELSRGDVRFLEALLAGGDESVLADISSRMGVKSNYASKYKERMLEAGVIGDRGGGSYGIDLPGFEGFLREKLA